MADEGDAASLTILGLRNKPRRGYPGQPRFSGKPELAYRQFRLAADQGDVQAQYWVGMMDWLRDTMLREGKIPEEDFDLIYLTDSPAEVVVHVVSSQPKRRL